MSKMPSPVPAPLASRATWRSAAALAVLGVAFGLLLGGLSAWFLGSVALAGLTAAAFTFNFHIPGALVRLFAIGRTVAKYGERLVGHKAALADQVARRTVLFRTMATAPATRSRGWQLGDEARLADYLDDVEDLDYGRLRIDMPAMAASVGLAATSVATAWVAPLALVPIVLMLAALVVSTLWLTRMGAPLLQARRASQRVGAQRLGAALASVVPLKAEHRLKAEYDAALATLTAAETSTLGLAKAQAWVDALAGLIGPAALLCVMAGAWLGGLRGDALLLPVFVAFAWLALGETLHGTSRMVAAQLRRRLARAELSAWAEDGDHQELASQSEPVAGLRIEALQPRAPDGRALGSRVTLALEAGRPTVLMGASGSGKTSLLKQIAGWHGNDVLASRDRSVSAAERQAMSCFCPHDAAILADTVRANLFAPDASDAELRAALTAVEMDRRIDAAGGLDAWITQDALSLGEAQRLNLARAWLTDRPVVLLDEPTEHLDARQGTRIVARLLDHLADRVVVLSSHASATMPRAVIIQM